MIKKMVLTLLLLVSSVCSIANAAPVLSFSPSSPTVTVGEQFSVDVMVSGLEAGGLDQILSAFDLSIAWDASMVELSSYSVFDLDGDGASTSLPSGLDLYGVSYVDDESLQALQGDSFTIAILDFNAIGGGAASLSFALHDLTGLNGLALEHIIENGSITVSAVPVPGAVWLLGTGLLGLWRLRNTVTVTPLKLA